MKTNLLFPHSFRTIGWLMFAAGTLLAVPILFLHYEPNWMEVQVPVLAGDQIFGTDRTWFTIRANNIADELTAVLFLVGAMFVAFSREKKEDEYIAKIRLDSLVWATYFNYGLLLFAILFVYDLSFYFIMLFNMFTILLFFIIRFRLVLWNAQKALNNEK